MFLLRNKQYFRIAFQYWFYTVTDMIVSLMKKLVVYILLLVSICIWCFQSTFASFMVMHENHSNTNTQVQEHPRMHHAMMWDSQEDTHGCEENKHECCLSPFIDSQAPSLILIKNNTIDSEDVDDKAILHNNQFQNSAERLTAPPPDERNEIKYIYSKTQYNYLIWIIRNNA